MPCCAIPDDFSSKIWFFYKWVPDKALTQGFVPGFLKMSQACAALESKAGGWFQHPTLALLLVHYWYYIAWTQNVILNDWTTKSVTLHLLTYIQQARRQRLSYLIVCWKQFTSYLHAPCPANGKDSTSLTWPSDGNYTVFCKTHSMNWHKSHTILKVDIRAWSLFVVTSAALLHFHWLSCIAPESPCKAGATSVATGTV